MKGVKGAGRLSRLALVVVAAVAMVVAVMGGGAGTAAAAPAGRFALPPLHTSGQLIVDALGRPVRVAATSWYGAESVDYAVGGLQTRPLNAIVAKVRELGFNAVRLQWSDQMVESNPVVPEYAVAANPALRGMHAMQVFDIVVASLSAHGIMVILDNHNSDAEWCCGGSDDNMLWYNSRYPESSWINDWKMLAARYAADPMVVGADLRNEPRSPATWGGPAATDWHAAAERAGDAVLAVNPRLLIFVEGIAYAGDLSGAGPLPVTLDQPGRLVYEAHDYAWYTGGYTDYQGWYQQIYPKWGFLVTGPDPQPLWVGEFGTCNTDANCVSASAPGANGFWFGMLTTFLQRYGVSWAYWPLNGTESTGSGRTWNGLESYGVLNTGWDGAASPALIDRLQQLQGTPQM